MLQLSPLVYDTHVARSVIRSMMGGELDIVT